MSTSHGLNTNILLPSLLADDDVQEKKARQFLRAYCTIENPGFSNHIVLCELAWTLKVSYKFSRQQISDTIRLILQTKELEVDRPLTVWAALHRYEKGSADFSDYLIGQYNRESGCTTTATFDSNAGKDDTFTLI